MKSLEQRSGGDEARRQGGRAQDESVVGIETERNERRRKQHRVLGVLQRFPEGCKAMLRVHPGEGRRRHDQQRRRDDDAPRSRARKRGATAEGDKAEDHAEKCDLRQRNRGRENVPIQCERLDRKEHGESECGPPRRYERAPGKERRKDHRRQRIERDRNGESVYDRKAHFVAFASNRSKSTRRRSTAGARFGNLPPIGSFGGKSAPRRSLSSERRAGRNPSARPRDALDAGRTFDIAYEIERPAFDLVVDRVRCTRRVFQAR